jgi:uncharacterized protein (DUF2147 family)
MKIRQFASLLILLYLVLGFDAKAQSENAILGKWYNTEKTAQIEIKKIGSEFFGNIIWLKDPTIDGKPITDQKNSDPKLRTRQLVGMPLLESLKFEKGMWKDGEIYDPFSGKTYSCEVKLRTIDVLEVKGYIGFSFVGRTVVWHRVK